VEVQVSGSEEVVIGGGRGVNEYDRPWLQVRGESYADVKTRTQRQTEEIMARHGIIYAKRDDVTAQRNALDAPAEILQMLGEGARMEVAVVADGIQIRFGEHVVVGTAFEDAIAKAWYTVREALAAKAVLPPEEIREHRPLEPLVYTPMSREDVETALRRGQAVWGEEKWRASADFRSAG
jgi:hypothetical protein